MPKIINALSISKKIEHDKTDPPLVLKADSFSLSIIKNEFKLAFDYPKGMTQNLTIKMTYNEIIDLFEHVITQHDKLQQIHGVTA